MKSGILIDIGDTPILLRVRDCVLRDAIRERYAAFVTPLGASAPVELTVEVAVDQWPDQVPFRPGDAAAVLEVVYSGNLWKFRWFDLRMEWSPKTGKGSAQVRPGTRAIDSSLRLLHSVLAVRGGGCLLHASSVAHHGSSYVFAGQSEAGKTTISNLRPPGATLLSDEMSYIRPEKDGYRTFGTPFASKTGAPGTNNSAPLKAVYLLAKGSENKIEPISRKLAPAALLRNLLFFAKDAALAARAFETACQIADSVPLYRLTFAPTPSVWEIIR